MTNHRSNSRWSRREFIAASLLGATAVSAPALASAQETGAPTTPPKPPPLALPLVREFVGAAHGNLERTRELLGNEPGLLNATWDWKAGDFETAIGGAGHMGRRDIATFLLGQGARMDVFVAAMLGELAIVQAFLAAYPNLAGSKGPHGIPLVAHARAGGENAAEVLAYLTALEAK